MADLLQYFPLLASLLVIGALAGVLAGLLGVGGGIVLVPQFFFMFGALGYDTPHLMQLCLATSLATIVVTSTRSVQLHNKRGAVDWDILRGFGPGIAVGAVVGMIMVALLTSGVLQMVFGVLALVVGLYMIFGKSEWRFADAMPTGIKGAMLSPVIGFLSVLMGVGGGSFGVPTMTLFGTPIHRAVATAAGFGVIIAVPAVIGFLFVSLPEGAAPPFSIGAINVPAFFLVIMMTLITTPYGAKLAHRLDPKPLKRLFGVFLLAVAINMLRKALF